MDVLLIIKALYALAALVGATATLITAVNALRRPRGSYEKDKPMDKALERLSFMPRGYLRNGGGRKK